MGPEPSNIGDLPRLSEFLHRHLPHRQRPGAHSARPSLTERTVHVDFELDHPLQQLFPRRAGKVCEDDLLGKKAPQISELACRLPRGVDEISVTGVDGNERPLEVVG